jgi:hypothetical protein
MWRHQHGYVMTGKFEGFGPPHLRTNGTSGNLRRTHRPLAISTSHVLMSGKADCAAFLRLTAVQGCSLLLPCCRSVTGNPAEVVDFLA